MKNQFTFNIYLQVSENLKWHSYPMNFMTGESPMRFIVETRSLWTPWNYNEKYKISFAPLTHYTVVNASLFFSQQV